MCLVRPAPFIRDSSTYYYATAIISLANKMQKVEQLPVFSQERDCYFPVLFLSECFVYAVGSCTGRVDRG